MHVLLQFLSEAFRTGCARGQTLRGASRIEVALYMMQRKLCQLLNYRGKERTTCHIQYLFRTLEIALGEAAHWRFVMVSKAFKVGGLAYRRAENEREARGKGE